MTQIDIPDELAERITARVSNTEFRTVDEYTEFVLTHVLTHVERTAEGSDRQVSSRERVEKRLQSLGYLDDDE